jgi:hypothetical protein
MEVVPVGRVVGALVPLAVVVAGSPVVIGIVLAAQGLVGLV